MTAAVETMAYANQVPWHGLGNKVSNDLTPAQMLKAAGLDWQVVKRQMSFQSKDGKPIKVGEYALVRETDDAHLTTVGETWKPVQNVEALDFFKQFVTAGSMKMETAGSLWDGRYIWCLARVGNDFKIGKTDEIRPYLLLMSPHVHGNALIVQYTPIRVVCWNTLSMALGSGMKGKGPGFRMPHSSKFDDAMKDRAKEALGLAIKQTEEFKTVVQLLAKKKAPAPKVEEFFCEVLKFDPKKADKKKDGEVREPHKLPQFRAALAHAPGHELVTAQGTWWGALNAVTHVIDHQVGRERDTALKNAWVGHLAGVKRDALALAVKYAS